MIPTKDRLHSPVVVSLITLPWREHLFGSKLQKALVQLACRPVEPARED
jgi:hypothetical protein